MNEPEYITSRVTEVQGTIGLVYKTARGWWGTPYRPDAPSQLFDTRRDAVDYLTQASNWVLAQDERREESA